VTFFLGCGPHECGCGPATLRAPALRGIIPGAPLLLPASGSARCGRVHNLRQVCRYCSLLPAPRGAVVYTTSDKWVPQTNEKSDRNGGLAGWHLRRSPGLWVTHIPSLWGGRPQSRVRHRSRLQHRRCRSRHVPRPLIKFREKTPAGALTLLQGFGG
jgi:hypothetical protein